MTINQSGWKPTSPAAKDGGAPATFTGNRALMLDEALIFEIGTAETTGVDLDTSNVGPIVDMPDFGRGRRVVGRLVIGILLLGVAGAIVATILSHA